MLKNYENKIYNYDKNKILKNKLVKKQEMIDKILKSKDKELFVNYAKMILEIDELNRILENKHGK